MAINLGDKPLAGFDQPIEMMKDCHRRIEHFLGVLLTVGEELSEGELSAEGRRALEAALNYFANFAPRHTADEEESLFPRLCRSERAGSGLVTATLDRLGQDHQKLEGLQNSINRIIRDWLTAGRLDARSHHRYQALIDELSRSYHTHIRQEEECLFPLAGRVLPPGELREIGTEMRRRRSLPELPPKLTSRAVSSQT